MKSSIECTWNEGMNFETKIGEYSIQIDAHESVGGSNKGPTPKPFMLAALAGCTSMDVVSLLRKMRQKFTWYNIKIEANLTDEHPKYYDIVTLVYEFKESDGLDHTKVEKAVTMSQEKYCGVAHMFSKFAKLDYKIVYL